MNHPWFLRDERGRGAAAPLSPHPLSPLLSLPPVVRRADTTLNSGCLDLTYGRLKMVLTLGSTSFAARRT